MRHLKSNQFLAVACIAVFALGAFLAAAPDQGHINAHSITLTSPNGKSTITLMARDDISGIWVQRGPGEPFVSIYTDVRNGAVVGIAPSGDKIGKFGYPIALYADKKAAGIQVNDGKSYGAHVSSADLSSLLIEAGTKPAPPAEGK